MAGESKEPLHSLPAYSPVLQGGMARSMGNGYSLACLIRFRRLEFVAPCRPDATLSASSMPNLKPLESMHSEY